MARAEVFINRITMLQIEDTYNNNPIVSAAVNQLLKYVTKGGFEVIGLGKNSKYSLKEDDVLVQRFIERELVPAFTQMMLEMILYGFTTVRLARSLTNPNWVSISVVPISHVGHRIVWDDYDRMTVVAYAAYGVSQSYQDMLQHHRAFCLYNPSQYGEPNSPLAACLKRLMFGDRLWRYYLEASCRRVRPPYILSEADKKNEVMGPGGMETSRASTRLLTQISGIGHVGTEEAYNTAITRARAHRNAALAQSDRESEDLRTRTILAERQTSKQDDDSEFYKAIQKTPHDIKSIESATPYTNRWIAPSGFRLEGQYNFLGPENFQEMHNNITAELYNVLGLTTPSMLSGRVDNALSVKFAMQHLSDNIRWIQSRTKAIYEDVIVMMMGADLIDVMKSTEQTSFPEPIGGNDGSKISDLDFYQSEGIEKRDLALAADLAQYADVQVNFLCNYVTDYETAQVMYNDGLLKAEAFQDIAFHIAGLPPSMKTENVEAARKKLAEMKHVASKEPEKKKEKQKLLDKQSRKRPERPQ